MYQSLSIASLTCRNPILVIGDQLRRSANPLHGFDAGRERVWMVKLPENPTHAWSHRAAIMIYLSAMHHFRNNLHSRGSS